MSTVKRPSSMEKARTLTFEKTELLTDEIRELTSTPAKTAPGQMVEFYIQSSEIQKNLEEVQRTNEKLSSEMLSMSRKWDGASETRKIQPSQIVPSRWANRHEQSFLSPDFIKLKDEIDGAGGNVQPIKVRPLAGEDGKFEIVFGHRRHQACLDLGLPVLAMIEDLSEQELFSQMDRENRLRADLRPYEQGVMYAKALDGGLFPSLRKMADVLGVKAGNASRAISLARLPSALLDAFESPLDLQTNWAPVLTQAFQQNPEIILSKAKVLYGITPRPKASEIFRTLTELSGVISDNTPLGTPVSIKGKGDQAGQVLFNPKKKSFEITLSGVPKDRISDLEKLIESFLS